MNAPFLLAATESALGPTLAIIVGVGMLAQWVAWRTQIPSIIILLSAGLVLGPVGGVVDPDEFLGNSLFTVVSLAVALVLFEGGLDLSPRERHGTGPVVRRLISIGAICTFGVSAYAAQMVFDIEASASYVIAAVLVVTGPTVVGPLLRFVRPNGATGPILRAEGIMIDPIGATASLIAFEVALSDDANDAVLQVVLVVGLTLLIGFGIGFVGGYLIDNALRRFLVPDHLANPIAIASVVVAFVISNELQEESGLLTVTIMGMFLARRESAAVRHLLEFTETLKMILVSVLFILLAARIETEELYDVAVPSLLFIGILVFIARPLGVIVSTIRTDTTWRERLFLTAMAPRGIVAAAVSAIFSLRLEEEGIVGAELIAPVVFLVIIGTIVVYGFAAGPIARALGLAEAEANGVLIVGAHSTARGLAKELSKLDIATTMVDTDPYNVTRAVGAGLTARRLSVLAENAEHTIDMRGIGRLLALTSNDEVNALATGRFSRVFGRRETFQLAPAEERRTNAGSLHEEYLGRIIGIDGLTYDVLDDRTRNGWRIRAVEADYRLTDLAEAGEFVPIARVFEGQLSFVCRNDAVPSQGTVIGLASPDGIEQIEARAAKLAEFADEPAE